MSDAPDTIYLQWIPGYPKGFFGDEVTWCDEKINDDDIEYVRAPQWVSVEDDGLLLIYGMYLWGWDGEQVQKIRHYEGKFYDRNGSLYHPTHVRALEHRPAPPEGEGDD